MGCDIHGWVEVKKWEDENGKSEWEPMMNLDLISSRNYTIFGLLFGVRNYDKFVSKAPSRGLPVDVSDYVKERSEDLGIDGHSHSYITLNEILNVDWKQKICSTSITKYRINVDNDLGIKLDKEITFLSSYELTEKETVNIRDGNMLIKNGCFFMCEKISPEQFIDKSWKALFDIMKEYAKYSMYGAVGVRLVVWFDN